jgi:hypothetical protein
MFLDNDRCSERHIFVRTISSLSMNDREFLRAFHACKLSSEDFRHRGHLRLAWLVLRSHSLEEALQLLSVGIRQFASFKGANDMYNETLTQFWIRIVNHAIQEHPSAQEFEQFINTSPILMDKQLPYSHWRRETLGSNLARSGWLEPDLLPLPF